MTSMEPIRIGIGGAGGIAQRNARAAAASGVARIAGVYDVNHRVARDLARALRAPFFATWEEMLACDEVDAVLLSVPHHLHRPMTLEAASSGKHVLVEKPVANNLSEALQMDQACRKAGVQLTVNYSFRYLARNRMARELIAAGALGDIAGIQIINHQYKDIGYWSGARSNSPDDWRASREKCGGGYLIMNVCHVIDYVYFMTGLKAERVYGEYATRNSPAEVEDIVSVSGRMSNGSVCSITASSIMRGADQSEERIWGTNGSMVLSADCLSYYSTRPIDGRRPGKLHEFRKFPEVNWTAEWIRGFARAVSANERPEISFEDAWDNLAFIQAVYESMGRGSAVAVQPYPGAGPA